MDNKSKVRVIVKEKNDIGVLLIQETQIFHTIEEAEDFIDNFYKTGRKGKCIIEYIEVIDYDSPYKDSKYTKLMEKNKHELIEEIIERDSNPLKFLLGDVDIDYNRLKLLW